MPQPPALLRQSMMAQQLTAQRPVMCAINPAPGIRRRGTPAELQTGRKTGTRRQSETKLPTRRLEPLHPQTLPCRCSDRLQVRTSRRGHICKMRSTAIPTWRPTRTRRNGRRSRFILRNRLLWCSRRVVNNRAALIRACGSPGRRISPAGHSTCRRARKGIDIFAK